MGKQRFLGVEAAVAVTGEDFPTVLQVKFFQHFGGELLITIFVWASKILSFVHFVVMLMEMLASRKIFFVHLQAPSARSDGTVKSVRDSRAPFLIHRNVMMNNRDMFLEAFLRSKRLRALIACVRLAVNVLGGDFNVNNFC